MALTAQNVVDQASTDARQLLGNSGADAAILLTYVDRVHKDCLHNSLFSHLNIGVENVAALASVPTYTLVNTMRRLVRVYNRTSNRALGPVLHPEALEPMDALKQHNYRLAYAGGTPELYIKVGGNLTLMPTPTASYTIEVYFEKPVSTVSSLVTTLTIPEDGLDLLVAGVNYLTAQYLKKDSEAQSWFQVYEKLKKGEAVL